MTNQAQAAALEALQNELESAIAEQEAATDELRAVNGEIDALRVDRQEALEKVRAATKRIRDVRHRIHQANQTVVFRDRKRFG